MVKNRVSTDLNSRVFLSKNCRLIVAPRKFDDLKTNICPRSEASWKNILVFPPFSLIHDFAKKQNTRWNVSKISVINKSKIKNRSTCGKSICVLLTDRIEIHQSQPHSMTKRRLEAQTSGCNWWISIRSVNNNTQDWRKFWKRFRVCFVYQRKRW